MLNYGCEKVGKYVVESGLVETVEGVYVSSVLAVTGRRIWFLLTFTALPQEHNLSSDYDRTSLEVDTQHKLHLAVGPCPEIPVERRGDAPEV
jgi:hypothetical protein